MNTQVKVKQEVTPTYPHGIAYDNLFNAEHRDLMIETYGATSAQWVKVEELINK